MYIFKIYSSSKIHQTTAFNLKFIFVHSHAHPLSKYWLSQHNFKKQIPNWRKWPQFESCQMYIFKSTPHQQYTRQQPSTSNAYLSTPMHTLWAKIGWVSITLKNRFQIDANYLNLRVAKCIFSISTPHQQYTRQQPSNSNAYLSNPMHTLWAKIGWVSIFLKNPIPNWRKWPQFESCQMYMFKIYSSSTIHQTTTFKLKCIFVQSHAHPLSKNWLSQHIFNKQIPDRPKWPQFERCQMCIFKICSTSTIHQTPTFNLKCIFVNSHAYPLSQNWLSQHNFKKQIPNWRKLPQFESC